MLFIKEKSLYSYPGYVIIKSPNERGVLINMKYYICREYLYHDEVLVDSTSNSILTEKELPKKEETEITWENLDEVCKKCCDNNECFNNWHFKKGRILSLFNRSLSDENKSDIEKCKLPLNMRLVTTYIETEPTKIDLKYLDTVLVQKYLKEHSKKV